VELREAAMKRLLILIGLMVLVMAASASAYVLPIDSPHNSSTNIICGDCHSLFTIGAYDDSVCLSCHINDTGGGYTKNNAPKVVTHSSATTSAKYGVWTNNCISCHWIQNALHGQMQVLFYGSQAYLVTGTITSITDNGDGTTTFGYGGLVVNKAGWGDFNRWGQKSGNERGLIMYPNIANNRVNFEVESADATTITVTGGINTAFPGTVNIGNTLALVYGQFVRSSVSPTGGLGNAVKFFDNTSDNSFANDESGTGTDPNPDGICQVCHTQTLHWRNDGTLAAQGVHSAQNGANCMQCHPHAQGFAPTGACDSCHGFPPIEDVPNAASTGGNSGYVDNPALTGTTTAGKHDLHANTMGFGCDTCHTGGMPASAINNFSIEIGFDIFGTPGGDYDGRTLPLPNGYSYAAGNPQTNITNSNNMSCTNIYCHSTVQADGGLGAPTYATPTWTGAVVCGDCHAINPITGSHNPHLGQGYGCADCHNGAGSGTGLHVDNNIDIIIDPVLDWGASATYSQMPVNPAQNDYGTCSDVACHGGTSPKWGTNFAGIDSCTRCHGTPTPPAAPDSAKAPPQDTSGDLLATDPQVGAHQAHLQSLSDYTNDMACTECHTVPGAVSDPGHIDDGTPNAEMNFGALATTNGATPSFNTGTRQCSDTYCHGNAMPRGSTNGNNTTPTWNDPNYLTGVAANDCAQCHGYAPLDIPVHTGKLPTDCQTCHNHVNAAGDGFDDASLHVNGVLDGGGDNCFDCHSSAGGPAAGVVPDATHGKHIQTPYVGLVSSGDYGNFATNNWYGYSNTGGVPDMKCGFCHPQSDVTHMTRAQQEH
jgi:predicted CxxxxCH...CXXCH cytochrome family protein